ncbi:MAG TPA: type II CAAX endopeptidase family protein [Solirubrobacteraceae bacterium]|nr:type II CAAX endopeptidase family protein [Solirubrobacteraceae bacterium]
MRSDLLTAPERPAALAPPPPPPRPAQPHPRPAIWWWTPRAPHARPERPDGVERWRTDLVVAVPASRRRHRGLVLLRPLAAVPLVAAMILLRLAILVTLPVAWGCRVVANDLPRPLERLYRWMLRLVNRLRAWLWLTTDDPEAVALSLRRRPPHRRSRAWSWLLLAPFQLVLRYFSGVLVAVVVPAAWVAALVIGREPAPVQRLLAVVLAWLARGDAYLLLLSDRRPRLPEIAPRPPSGAPDATWPRLPPWPAWVAPASVGLGIGLIIASGLLVFAAAGATHTSLEHPDPGFDIASGAITSLTILASALVTARLTGRLRPWQFGLARLQAVRSVGWMFVALGGFVLTFAAVLAPFVLAGTLSLDDGAIGYRLSTGALPVDGSSGPPVIVGATLAIAVLAPICEEIFFRGVMFGSLRRWKGVWVAATITAVVFSAGHLEFSPVIFADRLIAGFVWCLVYARTGRLLPGMMAHAANNAVVIGLLLGWDWQIPLLVAACVATVTLCVSPFARRPGRVPRPEMVIA